MRQDNRIDRLDRLNRIEKKIKKILDIVVIYKDKWLYILNITGFIMVLFVFSTEARWEILKTPNFTCFYPTGYEWEAKQALSNLEHYKDDVVELTGNKKIGNLPVVIEDVGILPNGFADVLFKQINLFTYPPDSANHLISSQNWYRLVGVHEYTHIAHLTKASGVPGLLSSVYGGIFFPNLYSPGWIIEGIATFSESQASIYEGRLNEGIFDAIIKSKAAQKKFPSIVEATYLPLEFPGYTGMYLYGGEFFEFLSNKYGKDKFAQFFEIYGSSVLSYLSPVLPAISLDRAAKKVYGKSFDKLFLEWKTFLEQSCADFYIDGEQLTNLDAWLITSLLLSDNKLYYIRYYPRKTGAFSAFYFAEIIERDLTTQEEKVVISSTSDFISKLKKLEDKLYYAIYELKRGYSNSVYQGFGYFANFYEEDLKTGKKRLIFEDELRSFDVFEDKRVIYAKDKKHGFGSELWLVESTGEKRKIMDLDLLVCGLNILSDKKIIIEARANWQNSDIYLLDITTYQIKPLIQTPFIETNITISNKHLFFCANYNKELTIYAYDLETEKISKLTYGSLAGFPTFDDKTNQLYFVGLTASGVELYKKKIEKFDDFKLPNYPESLPPNFKPLVIQKGNKGDYLKTLIPKIRLPYSTKEGSGIILVGKDAIRENTYRLNIFSEKEKSSFFLNYICRRFKPSVLYINYGSGEEVSFRLKYPLRRKIASPPSVWVGFGYREFDKFKRNSFSPSFALSFNYPKTLVKFMFDYSLERKELGSTKDKDTIFGSLSLTQYIKDSQINLNTLGIYDADKTQSKIRGYEDTLKGRSIFSASLEYEQPILKLRKGLWNPNIFFEDLCFVALIEAAFSQNKTQFLVGVELQQEMSTSFGMTNFTPKIGITLNKEGEITIYFSLN